MKVKIIVDLDKDQEREKLMTEILSVINKFNSLRTNQPKVEIFEECSALDKLN